MGCRNRRHQNGKTEQFKAHQKEFHATNRRYKQKKRAGWGMDLYRDKDNGMFFGVCSGIAKALDIEPLLVRIAFVVGFFVLGGFTVFTYIAGIVLMGNAKAESDKTEHSEHTALRSKSLVLREAQQKLNRINERVGQMEGFVTSRQYRLKQEFKDL
jgi:phage shock protein C